MHKRFADELIEKGLQGEVSFEKDDLNTHAFDESIFHIQPDLVIYPKNAHDIEEAAALTNKFNKSGNTVSLTPRAAGSGLSGGSLNDSVIINTTRYLNKLLKARTNPDGSIDYTAQPGMYYRDLEKVMDKKNVYIPSLPASKDLCCLGGMFGNNAAGADTFRYGHTSDYVTSLKIVLADAKEYVVHSRLDYAGLTELLKRKDALGQLYGTVWDLVREHEAEINSAKPITRKNTAGYPLWNVLDCSVSDFKAGKGNFNIIELLCGSQGTLGIVTELTMRAVPKQKDTSLVVLPIFDLEQAGSVISYLAKQAPINIELYDDLTFSLALEHVDFFLDRMDQSAYRKFTKEITRTHKKDYNSNIPRFTLLTTFSKDQSSMLPHILERLQNQFSVSAEIVSNPVREHMFWQIRRASYSLSKLADPNKRPAAFLEDMSVKPQYIGAFFDDIQELFEQHDIRTAIHGHGGNGHLHFYPLMDFSDPKTPAKITELSEAFFTVAAKYHGTICGEHNDGIIRTPYLKIMFERKILDLFIRLEHMIDPLQIFNPGKKAEPKFDIQKSIRHTN